MKLDDLRRQVQLIGQLEENIGALEAELCYLDAVLAVPVPGEPHTGGSPVHDIISDIINWNQRHPPGCPTRYRPRLHRLSRRSPLTVPGRSGSLLDEGVLWSCCGNRLWFGASG